MSRFGVGATAPMVLLFSVLAVGCATDVAELADESEPTVGTKQAFLEADTAYQFVDTHPYEWVDISDTGTLVPVSDDGALAFDLPFEFQFYGTPFTSVTVGANGVLVFDAVTDKFPASNESLPVAVTAAQAFVAVHWDDILPPLSSFVGYQVDGEEPSRTVKIQWSNVVHFGSPGEDPGASFGIILEERTNLMVLQYESTDLGLNLSNGASATVGVQANEGFGQTYSFNTENLRSGLAILLQVDGCGADDECSDTCVYDPDCPVCITDGECNAACVAEVDPDCPVCVADDVCNEECDVDPDCDGSPELCIADEVCDVNCAVMGEDDPDCEICEENGVCNPRCTEEADPDCGGGCAAPAGPADSGRAPFLGLLVFALFLVGRRVRVSRQ